MDFPNNFRYPILMTGITMNEIPDKIAYYIEVGNCEQGCTDCHSAYLQEKVDSPTALNTIKAGVERAKERGADCVLLMGGTTNGIPLEELKYLIQELSSVMDVALFSGSNDKELHDDLIKNTKLRWLKTGSFKKELGGLDSPTTNQELLEIDDERNTKKYDFNNETT